MQGQGSITKSRWQKIKQHFSEAFSQEFVYQRSDYDSAQVDRLVKKRGRDAYRYILLLLAVILAPMDVMFVYARETLSAVAGLLLLALVLVNAELRFLWLALATALLIWVLVRTRRALQQPPSNQELG